MLMVGGGSVMVWRKIKSKDTALPVISAMGEQRLPYLLSNPGRSIFRITFFLPSVLFKCVAATITLFHILQLYRLKRNRQYFYYL